MSTKQETTLSLTHLNVLNNKQAIKALKALDGRDKDEVVGLNETHRIIPFVKRTMPTYRVHSARPIVKRRVTSPGRRNVSNDTSTLVAKRFEHLGEISQQVSQQWNPASGVAPDRWAIGVAFLGPRDRPIFHLNVHLNAGPEVLRGNDAKHPIVREYAESVEWTMDILSLYREQGFATLLSGDVNLPASVTRPWSIHPRLERAGMQVHTQHIDLIAASLAHFEPVHFRATRAARVRSDHDALHAKFKIRPHKR